jgi:hypothetical protein
LLEIRSPSAPVLEVVMSRLRPSPALVVALFAVVLAAGGVAVGATKPDSKKIVACADDRSGVLRLAEKEKCPKGDKRVAWRVNGAGPAGPAGPAGQDGLDGLDGSSGVDGVDGEDGTPGSALAYGHVNPDGTLDGPRSKNVDSVTKLSGSSAGVYCIALTVPAVNVVATLDGNIGDGASVRPIIRASLTVASGCPAETDVTVRILDESSSVAKPFYFAVN